jgi:hypothetical protein
MPALVDAAEVEPASGKDKRGMQKILTLVFRLLSVGFLRALGALACALGSSYVVRIVVILLHAIKKISHPPPTCNIFLLFSNIPK